MADPLLSIGMGANSGAVSRIEKFQAITRMVAWADRWGPPILAELRKEAPVQGTYKPVSGGALRDSIRYERQSAFAGVRLAFHTNLPYAPYVVGGTDPHAIDPVHARVLAWEDYSGWQFRAHVNHPGARANPFPQRVADRMLPAITRSLVDLFKEP